MKRLIVWLMFVLMSSPAFSADSLPSTTTRPLMLLSSERIASMQAQMSVNSDAWQFLDKQMTKYLTFDPYIKGEMVCPYVLGYKTTGNIAYRDRAIELLWEAYFSDIGNFDYTSRNGFRANAQWALLGYDWLYNDLTETQKKQARAIIATWADYWKGYIDDEGLITSGSSDSDEVTSLTSNLLMMAIALHGDDVVRATTMFEYADAMTSVNLVGKYTDDLFAGGVWGEGSDYSPYTEIFMLLTYMINKEARGIPYPNNYIDLAAEAQLHMTSPTYNTMFTYGDVEGVESWYIGLNDAHQIDFFSVYLAAGNDVKVKEAVRYWMSQASDFTFDGWRKPWWFLLGDDAGTIKSPADAGLSTRFQSGETSGLQVVSARTGWGPNDSVLWVINSPWTVDHRHKDALDFAWMRGGDWLTKEKPGYGTSISWATIRHNSILIENADKYIGSSNPTNRPLGTGTTYVDYGDKWDFFRMDATDIYNMSGYFTESYVDLVQRNILFMHDGWLVVHDKVDISSSDDCTWTGSSQSFNQPCNPRWKKWLMHFKGKPTNNSGVWTATEGDSKIFWKLATPNMVSTLIDESILWASEPDSQSPAVYNTYHLESEFISDVDNAEVIQVMYGGAITETSMPANKSLSVVGGSGVLIDSAAIVFADNNASYTVDAINHYIADLPTNTSITVTRGGEIVVDGVSSGPAGVIDFSAVSGTATYVVTLGSSKLVLPPTLHSL